MAIYFLRVHVYKSRLLGGILVKSQSFCLGWMKAGNVSSCKTRGNFQLSLQSVLRYCAKHFFFFKAHIKTNEERGTQYEPHPVFAAGSNFISSSQGAELPFLLLLPLTSSIHTFICPVSHPLVKQLSVHLLGTCESLQLHQSPHSALYWLTFSSPVASEDHSFASALCPSN